MVAYSFYDGDNRVMRYAETLAQRGDEVEVIALRRESGQRKTFLNGVKVFQIQERKRNETGKLSHLLRVLTFLLHATWLLTVRHIREPYNVVHVHSVPDFLVFAALVPRLTGARVLLDIHDILPEFYASKFKVSQQSLTFKLLVWVEQLSASLASHVIIANHLWHERLISRSVDASKCTTILNAPDRKIFQVQPRTRTDSRFVMIYPGTLNAHQGLDIAIRAVKLVVEKSPEAEFHIYGEGPSKPELVRLTHDIGLDRHVFFHPHCPLREMAIIVSGADLGVVPKRSDSFGNEAFSTKILEFMAMGIPVVAAETKIDRYYFNDSVIRFFRNGDSQDLADCILQLAANADTRRRMVRNALEYVARNDWESYRSIYLQIVDGTSKLRSQTATSAFN